MNRHWERAFAERREDLPGLSELRRGAFERFAAQGFPRPKSPGWRHTNVTPLSRIAFEVDKEPGELTDLPSLEGAALRIVFVDGRHRADLSSAPVAGVRVGSLRDEAASAELLGRDLEAANGSFVDLNTALVEDGAVVVVEPDATPGLLHLVFATTAHEEPTATVLRNVVRAGPGSKATIVEHYVGSGGPSLDSVVTDVEVAAGASLTHVRLQEEGPETFHVGDVRARVERDAQLASFSFAIGGNLTRTGVHITLAGPGAGCALVGLYLGRARQHHDHTTVVRHAAPHGTSYELYKGILDDHARGVFTGVVKVDPDAQKTVAEQSNRNLVLSEGAHADSEPQLEIHADDVRCSHGSAIGRLDDEALFYLRSRGIDAQQARVILTRAYAREVTDKLSAPLRATLEDKVEAWLQGESA